MRTPYSTFLFDLDGTLIDSVELILSSYRHTLTVHRGSVPSDDVWLSGLGTPLWEQLKLFTDDPDELEAMITTYRDHNISNHDAMVREYPGVLDAVRTLHGRGHRLGVVTSKVRQGAYRGLRRFEIEAYFEAIVGADDVPEHKPHPAPVLKALDLLEVQPENAIFVGDSPHDIKSGRAAGVRTVAVLWGPFRRAVLEAEEPDYLVATPAELLALTA